jgi:hypothetical protein
VARGDPFLSPWFWDARDHLDRVLSITVPFDNVTGDILNGIVIHRDPGCLYVRVVWDDPSDPQRAKRTPIAPEGDTTLTAQQLRQATGLRTLTDLQAVQVTAETT